MGISRTCPGTKNCNIQKPHIPTFGITIKIVLEPTSESSWFRNQKPGYLKGWRLTGFIVHPLAFLVRQYDVENKEKKIIKDESSTVGTGKPADNVLIKYS